MSFDPFTAGFDLAKTVLDKFFPDANEEMKNKFAQASQEITKEYDVVLAQLAINQEEAKSPHWFVAGGRPAAIWVCVLSLFYNGIGISIGSWIAMAFGLSPLPIVDSAAQNALLMALLGVGGMRSLEKLRGVDTKRVGK